MTDNRFAVIGATGRTGVPLVTQALERGAAVRALARSAEKAKSTLPDGAEVVVGDATDADALRTLVDGVDVVLDVSGPIKGGPDGYRTASTRALLDAIADRPGPRLIHLTGAGVRQPGDRPGIADHAVRGLMMVVARRLLQNSIAAVEALHRAPTTALIVRCPRLTDGEPTGTYRMADAVRRDSGMQITRADLATALLDLAERETWPSGSPVISA